VAGNDEWLQVRCTVKGILDDAVLPVGRASPASPRREGTFSLVVDTSGARVRRLPSLYFERVQVFAARDAGRVLRRLALLARRVLEADRVPTYAMQSCRLDGQVGLYGRDLFNRSAYRRALARLGMEFSDDAYVQFMPDATFRAGDWGDVSPSFVILLVARHEPPAVRRLSGGLLTYLAAARRLGPAGPEELRRLRWALSGSRGLASSDPAEMVAALRRVRERVP
jgi:hypothetical protein